MSFELFSGLLSAKYLLYIIGILGILFVLTIISQFMIRSLFEFFEDATKQKRMASLISSKIQRLPDISAAIIGLTFGIPLMSIIATAIKMNSSGPIFYSTLYCGAYGKKFRIYKFRTLVKNANEIIKQRQRPLYGEAEDDPIITSVGRTLRKTGLDELPLLVNVLKGDMSIVGPELATPKDNKDWGLYSEKSSIKPGFFYVGYRDSYFFDPHKHITKKIINRKKLLAKDKKYIRHPSLGFSTAILIQGLWTTMIRTLFVFFKMKTVSTK